MKNCRRRSSICVLVLLLSPFLALPEQVEDYRGSMKYTPYTGFKAMLQSLDSGNMDSVKKISELFDPFYQDIRKSYNVDLEAELNASIKSADLDKTRATIKRMVFYDIKSLMNLASGQPENKKAIGFLKTAFLDYTLISPDVQKVDFQSDQMIKKLFQRAYQLTGSDSPFADADTMHIQQNISQVTREIENRILKALPKLKNPVA